MGFYIQMNVVLLIHESPKLKLYTNPSSAGCVSPDLRRATFLSFDIKTIAKMRRKPQHVGNIDSDVPYMLRFSSHICNGFYIKWQKCDAT